MGEGAMTTGMFAKVAGAWVEIGSTVDPHPPAVITGGTVTRATGTDGKTYDFHKFTANGAGPTVTTSGRARVLVAGGAGGQGGDGGGGAGGYLDIVLELMAGDSYPVIIGAAGTTGTSGTDGSESAFSAFRALGGGGGASSVSGAGNGGSGGGHGRGNNSGGAAILTYGRQGYDGAAPTPFGNVNGGGGAAGPGEPRNDGNANNGRGGPGKTWLDGVVYCSGGCYGTGSSPSAGGGQTAADTDAAANTGRSGGGYNRASAAGVVIIAVEVTA